MDEEIARKLAERFIELELRLHATETVAKVLVDLAIKEKPALHAHILRTMDEVLGRGTEWDIAPRAKGELVKYRGDH
jgi:hypothetical protein